MKRSVKAAVAVAAGGSLLLGGAGSLAFWSETEDAPGDTVVSGSLDLGAPSCGGWKIDGGAAFNPASDTIVPGDTLTQVCDFVVEADGEHLAANVTTETPSLTSSPLADELTYDATYTLDSVALDPTDPATDITEANDGDTLSATIVVTFPGAGATNASNNGAEYGNSALTAVLDAITVTLTQTHA